MNQITTGARNFLHTPRGRTARADDAWYRILEKPTEIVIKRHGEGTLDAQTVRVEYSSATSRGNEAVGQAGRSSSQTAIIFGIRGHATIPDTDIREGDRFTLDGVQFKVASVTLTTGESQSVAEVQS